MESSRPSNAFLERPRGSRPPRVLIKGGAGSGKTSLALYLAARQDESVLLVHGSKAGALHDCHSWFFKDRETPYIVEAVPSSPLDEIIARAAREATSRPGGKSSTLVIDGWNEIARASRANMSLDQVEACLVEALGQLEETSVIVTVDGLAPSRLDFFFDSIVELRNECRWWGKTRALVIRKHAGIEISRDRVTYTLAGGRFTPCIPLGNGSLAPGGNANVTFFGDINRDETGIIPLTLGSFNLVEVGSSVDLSGTAAILTTLMASWLNSGKGVLTSSFAGFKSLALDKRTLMQLVDPETLLDRFKLIEENQVNNIDSREYSVKIATREKELFSSFVDVYDLHDATTKHKPILALMQYSIEDLAQGSMRNQVLNHVRFVKNANVMEVAIIPLIAPGSESTYSMALENLRLMADTRVVIDEVHGATIAKPIKPSLPGKWVLAARDVGLSYQLVDLS